MESVSSPERKEEFVIGQVVRFFDNGDDPLSTGRGLKTGQVTQVMTANITVKVGDILINVGRENLYDSVFMQKLLEDRDMLKFLTENNG